MTREQHALGSSSSISGNGGVGGDGGGKNNDKNSRPAKNGNNKPKKIPQRGVGIAELEKRRLQDEMNDNNKANLRIPNLAVDLSPSHSPNNPIQGPTLLPSASFPPSLNQPHLGGWETSKLESGRWSIPRAGGSGRLGFRFRPAHETSGAQALPSTDATANICSGISPETALDLQQQQQIEPPSNQSFIGSRSSEPPFSGEANTMVGTKRLCPFGTPGSSSTTYFDGPFRPTFAARRSSSDELTLGYPSSHFEPRNRSVIRECHSSSKLNPTEDSKKIMGDFLTLDPPNVSLPPENQEHINGQMHQRGSTAGRAFSLFPDLQQDDDQSALDDERKDEEEETIDLELKL